MNNTSNTCMAYDISGLASHPSWFHKQKGFQWDRSYPSDKCVIADTTSSFRSETWSNRILSQIQRLLRFNKN